MVLGPLSSYFGRHDIINVMNAPRPSSSETRLNRNNTVVLLDTERQEVMYDILCM